MRGSFKTAVIAGSSLLVAAMAANAGGAPSTPSETRGFESCVNKAERTTGQLSVESDYYLNTHAESREFFLNAHARHGELWGPVRIRCETSRNGTRVLAVNVEKGSYLGRIAPNVAQN